MYGTVYGFVNYEVLYSTYEETLSHLKRFRLPGTIPTRHGTGTGYGYRTGYTKAYSISAARYQGKVASDLFAAKFGENGVCAFRTCRTTYFILLSPSAHPSNN